MNSIILAVAMLGGGPDFAAASADWQQYAGTADGGYIKYLSTATVPESQREAIEKAIPFWVNSLSSISTITRPVQVGPTLWRIDIRQYGWDWRAWSNLTYADPYYGHAEHGLILRADYFLAQTSNEVRSPAYGEFLYGVGKAPKTIEDFKKRWHVDLALVKAEYKQVGATVRKGQSGVAWHNRALFRAPTALGGAYWESYDFLSSAGDQNLQRNLRPEDFKHDAQEFFASLPNDLMASGLSNGQGKIVPEADPKIAHDDLNHENNVVVNPVSCVRCHGTSNGYHLPKASLPPLLKDKIRLNAYDYKTALELRALYLTEDLTELQSGSLIGWDRTRFERAVNLCNGLTPQANSLAFASVLKWYDGDVDLQQAAVETCRDLVTVRMACKMDREGVLLGLIDGHAIPRDDWESTTYAQLVFLLSQIKATK